MGEPTYVQASRWTWKLLGLSPLGLKMSNTVPMPCSCPAPRHHHPSLHPRRCLGISSIASPKKMMERWLANLPAVVHYSIAQLSACCAEGERRRDIRYKAAWRLSTCSAAFRILLWASLLAVHSSAIENRASPGGTASQPGSRFKRCIAYSSTGCVQQKTIVETG